MKLCTQAEFTFLMEKKKKEPHWIILTNATEFSPNMK